MKNKLQPLLKLHSIDQVILKLKNSSEEIPMRQNLLQQEKSKYENELKQISSIVAEAEKKRRDLEGELQLHVQKMKDKESRMHEIKTNKEYHAVQKEIDLAKKTNTEREEKILELMEQVEQKKNEFNAKQDEYNPKFDSIDSEQTELKKEYDVLASKIEEQEKERNVVIPEVDPKLLKTYENIRKKRPAPTIVPVDGYICHACHMNIPPQQVIELKKYLSLLTCWHCQRILYWAEEQNSVEEVK